jgi:hypothetical protein
VKSDSSRDTFRATKHYAQVRMQQGRVQVDADWNEQGEIIGHRIETESFDTIGPSGGPLHDAGFQIVVPGSGVAAGNFQITAGRFYVDGILCINDAPATYTTQPDLPGATAVSGAASLYVAYLDVWQRHLTALDDPSIREVALGGPDTATRVKTVWQVKLFNAGNVQGNCLTAFPNLNVLMAPQTGRLAARTKQEAGSTNPCIVPPGAGYRGLENQLYRVEVHGTGTAVNVNSAPATFVVTPVANKTNQVTFTTGTWSVGQPIEMVSVKPGASPMNGTLATISAVDETAKIITLNTNLASIDPADMRFRLVGATFKWSRDNGAIVTAVENVNSAEVTVHDLGPDAVLGFREGGWVEYIDDAMELNGQPGVLAQVLKIDRATNVVTLSVAPPPLVVSGGVPNLSRHPKLRVWHGVGAIKFRPGGAPADDLELENGVMIRFTGGTFRNGDYWTIPARTATADAQSGNIEWPTGSGGTPVEQLPFGIRHHYSRLAMLQWNGTAFASISDCRNLFPPVTELTKLVYVSGDGQEAMPNNSIPQPLMVGVFNGRWPVNGVRVRFTAEANGRLAPTAAGLPGTVNTVTIVTGPASGNPDGIASCAWRLDADVTNTSQQVEARLLDANGDATPSIVRFNGNHSIASQVAYDPGQCTSMQGRGTVQTAIDQLARLVSLYEVSGGHQDIVPGATLEPLIVLAANRCGPVQGRKVTFKVVAGTGTLSAPEGTTDANGRATVTWTPDITTLRQQVEATLVDDPPVSVASPTTVRFVANLDQSAREPGIHILQITAIADNATLENDSIVPVSRLEKGITVLCDETVVATTVGPAPAPIAFPQATPFKPTCFVTIDLPYPIGADNNFWDFGGIVGYQPLILAANVVIAGREIRWSLTDNANRWVQGFLITFLQRNQITDRVLAHLTLKGNFIWSGTTAATQKYLDGEAFGRASSAGRTILNLPSGDDRKGGDFEMWFWLSPRPTPGSPVIEFGVTPNRTIQGTFRDPTGGTLPGIAITLVPAVPTVGTRTATTDANGAFAFAPVPAGNYTLTINFSGVTITRPVTVP